MTTTRRTIRDEEFVNFPNNENAEDHPTAPGIIPQETSTSGQTGSGATFTISNPTHRKNFFATVTLTNSNPESKLLEQTVDYSNYLVDDPVYGVPASRCKVDINLGCYAFGTVDTLGNGVGLTSSGSFTAPADAGAPNGGTVNASSTNTIWSILRDSAGNLKQGGSNVTMEEGGMGQHIANFDQRKTKATYRVIASSNLPNNFINDTTLRVAFSYGGPLSRFWEADLHVIDGLNGDSVTFNTVTSTLNVTTKVIKFSESVQASSTSLAEDTVNLKLAGEVSPPTVTSSFSVTPFFKIGFTKQLPAISTLDVTTFNFVRLDPLTLSSTSSLSVTPAFKLGPPSTTTFSSTASATGTATQVYDIAGDYTWENVADIATDEQYTWDQRDQSWDVWEDNIWGLEPEQWDNWDLNLWARPYNLIARVSTTEDPTFKPAGISTLTEAFSLTEDSALEERAEAILTSTFTIEPTAAGVLEGRASVSGAFSPTLSDGVIYDQPSTVTITGAFTPVLTANATFSGETALSSAFSFAISPTHKRGPFQLTFTATFTQPDTIPSRKLGPFQLVLPALASTLITPRLFFQTDPFNIAKVDEETRIVVIPQETRITAIDQENRVNNITQETRVHLVSQETRRHKLRIPPIKDRFSTPKTRIEV